MLSAGAVGLALALDAAVAEPPTTVHPVAWFGHTVGPLDRDWPAPRLVGLLGALALPLTAAAVVWGGVTVATGVEPLAGAAVAGLALFVTTSLRRLLSAARDVSEASERDLATAREDLRALAGRDATDLSAGAVRSAAVESAAENLADGLVAPLAAFALGAQFSLAVGAAAAVWVKAINTMDSMLGYHSKPVGWGPARLDDAVMWLPARASALLLAVAAAAPTALRRATRWVGSVPSPNSGWPMGTLAAALDVRLEKPGVYVLNPDAGLPTVDDARAAVRVVAVAGVLAYATTAAVVLLPEVR
ncbi:adenosylcobinamide-phosphate synthase CbiB [Halorientalis sp. IM1011]|uniref:adenosylcobinamide-phosphate synthase CbiB n=1 Tax=Halorientalis sp. IM1011 TaxID=1932360 RepID=UPI0015603904|nr:adenosylcobinamide-phosphate synthase CbiB [Halorientalis sp. IM1011]